MNAARHRSQDLHTRWYNKPMRLHDYTPRPAHIKWLLDSDTAFRWQVMRDLTGEAPNAIAAERSLVATHLRTTRWNAGRVRAVYRILPECEGQQGLRTNKAELLGH